MVIGISDIPTILVIAGIVFIFLAIAGEITGQIKTIIPPDKRKVLGIIGAVFLVVGLVAPSTGIFSPSVPPIPTLTPTPTPTLTPTVSLTPIQTATPTSSLNITITRPKEGDKVPVSNEVSGTVTGELEQGQFMWLVINPSTSLGQWWPQGGRIDPWKGQWNIQATFGSENKDIGTKFDIAVILVNEKDNQYYSNYLETGQRTGSFPGIPLTPSAKIMDRITVVRI